MGISERLARHRHTDTRRKVILEVEEEVEDQNKEFPITGREGEARGIEVHKLGSGIAHCGERIVEYRGGLGAGAVNALTRDAYLRVLQSVRIEKLRIVGGDLRTRREPALSEWDAAGGGIASVGALARDHAEHGCSVSKSAGVRADCVLRVRDGHHTGATGETNRWLERGHAARVGRRDDTAISLAAEGDCGEIGRGCCG